MDRILHHLGIDRLSVPERLELIGMIWGSIAAADEVLPIPDWHLRTLEQRRAAADAEPGASLPWEVVKARLMGRA